MYRMSIRCVNSSFRPLYMQSLSCTIQIRNLVIQFPLTQSKGFLIPVTHTVMSQLSILSFSSLFKSTIMFSYGKYLIIPAQGTNSKDGIRALTISAIQFFMVSQRKLISCWRQLHQQKVLIYLAYDLLHYYACQRST